MIGAQLARLERDKREIVKSVMQLAFYYRGGLSYEEIMWMSGYERRLAFDWHKEYVDNELKIRPQTPNY